MTSRLATMTPQGGSSACAPSVSALDTGPPDRPPRPPGPGVLRRVTRRGLILLGGIGAAWVVGALLHSPAAGAATVPGLPSSSSVPAAGLAAPVAGLVDGAVSGVVAPTVPDVTATASKPTSAVSALSLPGASSGSSEAPILPAVAAPLRSTLPALVPTLELALPPVLEPVQTILGTVPLGGVVTPSPAPIRQGPPAASILTGTQPVAPAEAESSGALAPDAAVSAMHAVLSRPTGSVPSSSMPAGWPPQPAPQAPGWPPPSLPDAPPDAGGAGSGGSSAAASNAVLPGATPSATGLSIRLPIDDRSAVARLIADDPSFSPD